MISLRKLEASKNFRPCDVTTKPCLKLTCKISFFKASYLQMIFYMFFPCFPCCFFGGLDLVLWISRCTPPASPPVAPGEPRVWHERRRGVRTFEGELRSKCGEGLVDQVVRGSTWGGHPLWFGWKCEVLRYL